MIILEDKSYHYRVVVIRRYNQCETPVQDVATNQTIRFVSEAKLPAMQIDWVWMWLINCTTSLVCYFLSRSAAKIHIQRICYALPLILTTPVLIGMVVGTCEFWNQDPCTYTGNDLNGYLFHKCYESGTALTAFVDQVWYLICFWWLSQVWITVHVWFPKAEKLAKAER